MNCFICLVLTGLMSVTAFAQSTPENKSEPRSLNDRTVSDRLQKDLYKRNSKLTDKPISWYDTGDGYYGTYANDNQNYMTRYDRQGNYVETMTKKEWNANVPSSVKTSFEGSPYKSQRVTSYWEVSDANRKGYYMELNDEKGKMSRVWSNEKGEFTTDTPALNNKSANDKIAATEKTQSRETKDMEVDTSSWPTSSRMAVKEITDKYGKPDGVTDQELTWMNKGVWKKICITKDESKHSFPIEHTDMMTTTISYKVPEDKMDDLGKFDGSVTFDRTQGTLSARCDKEGNNLLALNLANDIITGKKTVEQARKSYGDIVKEKMNGASPAYMENLAFATESNTADPDKNTTGLTKEDVANGNKKSGSN